MTRYEPNNNFNEAHDLGVLPEYFYDYGFDIASPGDEDWYKFTLDSEGQLGDGVEVFFWHDDGDIDIELYDSTGTALLNYSSGVEDVEYISFEGLSAGEYFLNVYGFAGSTNPYYDLTFFTSPENATESDDLFEDNDNFNSAALLNLNSETQVDLFPLYQWNDLKIISGDIDWYKFTIPDSISFSDEVSIDFSHDEGDLELELYNSDNEFIDGSYSINDYEYVSLAGLPEGEYFLKVYSFDETSNSSYDLNISFLNLDSTDSFEDNDDFNSATLLDLGSQDRWFNLSIESGDDDWYRFTIPDSISFSDAVSIDFSHDEGDLDLELYNSNNEFIAGSYSTDDYETIYFDDYNLSGEEYFLRVHGYAGASNPDYSLTIDVADTTSTNGDILEENDSFNTARLLELSSTGRKDWYDLSIESGDDDWYRFELGARGGIDNEVSISFNHFLGDLDLELYDEDGDLLEISDSVNDFESVSLYNYDPGTYYARVYGYSGAENPDYSLTVDVPAITTGDDSYEDNDNFDNAANITEKIGQNIEQLVIAGSDEDWFKFTLDAEGQDGDFVEIDNFNSYLADLDLELYDAGGYLINSSTSVSDTETISLDGLNPGEYFVQVYDFKQLFSDAATEVSTNYNLLVQASGGGNINLEGIGDRYEFNDTPETATDFRNLTSSISEENLSIHEAGNADWFKFTTQAEGEVNINIEFEHIDGDLDLAVYDGNNVLVGESYSISDVETVTIPEATPGDYFVEVYGYDGATNSDYTLNIDAPIANANPNENDKPPENGEQSLEDDWTVLVYINADNDLEGAGLDDINEMEAVNLPDNVNVVVQIDRSEGYDSSNGDWTDTRRGLIQHDSNINRISSNLESIGEQDMGSPQTLTDFIAWGTENYQAKNYSVVVWDHGGGLDGISWDETDNYNNLSINDVTEAITDANLGDSLKMVGFDACLMALAEVGYDLRDLTEVVVSSQQIELGDGWDYEGWLQRLADVGGNMTAEQLGSAVVESYDEFYDGKWTQSAIKTDGYDDLHSAINNFASTVLNNATDSDWYGIIQARYSALEHDWQLPNERDLLGFMEGVKENAVTEVIKTKAKEVIDAINDTVITQVELNVDYGGIGIYLPSANGNIRGDYNESELSFLANNAWDDFVRGLTSDANRSDRSFAFSDITETTNDSQGTRSINFADNSSKAFDLKTLAINTRYPNLSIDSTSDEDWFKFNLQNDTTTGSIEILFSHTQGNLDVKLYREGDLDNIIRESKTEDDNEKIELNGLSTGNYLLKVDGDVNPEYELKINAPDTDTIPEDEYEKNDAGENTGDSISTAVNIGSIGRNEEFVIRGLTMEDAPENAIPITDLTNTNENNTIALKSNNDSDGLPTGGDWFKFDSVRNTDLNPNTVTITFDNDKGNLDLYLFDEDYNLIDSSETAKGVESVSFPEQSSEFFVYVTGDNNLNYELNVARRQFDIDGNGEADSKDLLLTFLASSSFSDENIENFIEDFDLVSNNATRSSISEIKDYVETANNNILDIDGNGEADSKDLLLTFLASSSFSDENIESFIEDFGLISDSSERKNVAEIKDFVNQFQPEPTSAPDESTVSVAQSFYGNDENNTLTGTAGDDILVGGAGDDRLVGEAGNDSFYGGIGNDTLVGGTNADTFIFGLDSGNDVIEDFQAEDKILLDSSLGFNNSEEILAAISPTNSASELIISEEDKISIFHEEPLVADNFDFI
ncbi:MAG: clostripain-related cysteine peptidase [Xenococcaceae cyanobacterium]